MQPTLYVQQISINMNNLQQDLHGKKRKKKKKKVFNFKGVMEKIFILL